MSAKNSTDISKDKFDGKKLGLALLMLLSAVGLFWLATRDEETLSENDLIPVQLSDEMVNKHLHKTSMKIESQKVKAQIENFTKAPRLDEATTVQSYEASSHSLDFKPDPRINELATRLDSEKKQGSRPSADPKEVIQMQMYEQQKWNEYNLAYRQAYAEKFVENARRNGWEIRLNDEYKVIRVKAIKKDNRVQLFKDRIPNSATSQSPN